MDADEAVVSDQEVLPIEQDPDVDKDVAWHLKNLDGGPDADALLVRALAHRIATTLPNCRGGIAPGLIGYDIGMAMQSLATAVEELVSSWGPSELEERELSAAARLRDVGRDVAELLGCC